MRIDRGRRLEWIKVISVDHCFLKFRLSDMSGLDLMTAIKKKFSKAGIIIVDTAVPDDFRMKAFASAPSLAQNI